jgi:tRNA pseudouridine65 synthase
MKHIFHPILGDTTHGDGHHNRLLRDHFQSSSLMLSAIRLEILHPKHAEPLSLETQPDAAFIHTLEKLGFSGTDHLSADCRGPALPSQKPIPGYKLHSP